jgi:hypothetical protein
MRNLNHENIGSPDFWPRSETAWPHPPAEVPYEKTARAVLWRMGLVLGGALGFAFAVDLALIVFHVG